jgi:excinuclease UvrABC helicase subunit UvrB
MRELFRTTPWIFVSYYDYYRPEAYILKRHYIEKDAIVNDESIACGTARRDHCYPPQ